MLPTSETVNAQPGARVDVLPRVAAVHTHTPVKLLNMHEELRGDCYVRFGKATHMWLRLFAGKNRELFFVFQESSLAMNRKNKRNV